MRRQFALLAALGLSMLLGTGCSQDTAVSSPDGGLTLRVAERDGRIGYTLSRGETLLLDFSTLGFELRDAPALRDGLTIDATARTSFDQTWEQVWGEEHFVRNRYNELRVTVREREAPGRRFDAVFRLFDDGVGFRCEFPEQPALGEFVIMDELTEFRFPQDHMAWWMPTREPYYESIARHTPLSRMDTVNTPLTLECADGTYLALHEADLTDYAKMSLRPAGEEGTTLRCCLTPWSNGVKVYARTPFRTPWRTVVVGDTPGDLATSRLMLNLNEPSKIEDTSWIRPGKYIGIWWSMHLFQETWAQGPEHGATTENMMRYIDFAAENGIQGVLAEGWNVGWDGAWTKNTDRISFTQPYPDFDIARIAEYAASKGVELIGHHETGANTKNYETQMEEAFAFYRKYGVRVVKTGYVNVLMDGKELHDSQYGVRHYRRVIETAARYGICIDNHEPVMPTGLERTWPNLMTQEGVRGQEYNAWSPDGGNPPEHTTVLPFLRGLAGPMDYTFGTFDFSNPVSLRARAIDRGPRTGPLRRDIQPVADGFGPAGELRRKTRLRLHPRRADRLGADRRAAGRHRRLLRLRASGARRGGLVSGRRYGRRAAHGRGRAVVPHARTEIHGANLRRRRGGRLEDESLCRRNHGTRGRGRRQAHDPHGIGRRLRRPVQGPKNRIGP